MRDALQQVQVQGYVGKGVHHLEKAMNTEQKNIDGYDRNDEPTCCQPYASFWHGTSLVTPLNSEAKLGDQLQY